MCYILSDMCYIYIMSNNIFNVSLIKLNILNIGG